MVEGGAFKAAANRTDTAITAILDEIREVTNVPGIAAVAVHNGRVVAGYSGVAVAGQPAPLSAASRFDMSCLMKFFLAVVTHKGIAEGSFALDTPVADILPEIRAGGDTITIGHLLSHTSGYHGLDVTDSRTRWAYSWEKFVSHLNAAGPHFAPGSVFNYEHSEHVVLGEIWRRTSGCSAYEIVARELFSPLGVRTGNGKMDKLDPDAFVASHMATPGTNRYTPASIPPFCSFWDASLPDRSIALEDVAKIGSALIEGGCEVLEEPVITLVPGVASDAGAELVPRAFGMGCGHYSADCIGHNGSALGQTCGLRLMPKSRLSVAVGVNAWSPYARDTALQNIIAVMSGGERRTPSLQYAPAVFPLEMLTGDLSVDELTGEYRGSYLGCIQVSREGGALRFDAGPAGTRRHTFWIAPQKGELFAFKGAASISVGFFRSPAPALQIGVHAYRKQ